MSITLKCYVCGAINQVTCSGCNSPHFEIVGRFGLYLPDSQVFISIASDETGRYLRIKKPTSEQLIPLQEKEKSNDDPL